MSGKQQQSTSGDKFKGRIKPRRKSLRSSRARRYDGEQPQFKLKNCDPDVSYAWVRQGGGLGVGNQYYYEHLGYQVILATEDPNEVHPLTERRVATGEPFIREDLILMGIHKDDRDLLVDEGHDGYGGRVAAAEKHARLAKGRSAADRQSHAGISPDMLAQSGAAMENHKSTGVSVMHGRRV